MAPGSIPDGKSADRHRLVIGSMGSSRSGSGPFLISSRSSTHPSLPSRLSILAYPRGSLSVPILQPEPQAASAPRRCDNRSRSHHKRSNRIPSAILRRMWHPAVSSRPAIQAPSVDSDHLGGVIVPEILGSIQPPGSGFGSVRGGAPFLPSNTHHK